MKKGFALNDEWLRNPCEFGADYFDELLERIRDIRASEKRVYQKVKEIFALSVDYDSKSQLAQSFLKSVQNKLEYAATSHTAPERCDGSQKLHDPRADQHVESHCEYVSGLCGVAGKGTPPHAHGGLGEQDGDFLRFNG